MARAQPRTWLPIDEFARIAGISPLHFNMLESDSRPITHCNRVWVQESWQQAGAVGRDEVADYVQQAEVDLSRLLGYNLVPEWRDDDHLPQQRPWQRNTVHLGTHGFDGFSYRVNLPRGRYISGGVRAKVAIDASAAVAWPGGADETYDTNRLATLTVPGVPGNASADEIRVYFRPADIADAVATDADDAWEVRPLESVSISAGGVATIQIRRELLVDPNAWTTPDPTVQDADENDTFVDAVQVYRVFNDPQTQANLVWRPDASVQTGCDCAACTFTVQTACLHRHDATWGIVSWSPAEWDADDESFTEHALTTCRTPDEVRAFTYSGFQSQRVALPRVTMDPELQRLTTILAASYLPRPLCGCTEAARVHEWADDVALANEERTFAHPARDLDNPLGTTKGAIYVWRRIRDRVVPPALAGVTLR